MNGMEKLICPVCKGHLTQKDKALVCENNHSYDISKYGYVNLMRSQKSSKKRHGDDKLMLKSRHNFLEKGYYKPLLETLTAEVLKKSDGRNITVLDVGCGEGYYTANIKKSVEGCDMYGIDISKDALIYANKRDKSISLAVASCSEIPIESGSCDVVLNIFSPTNVTEYSRVLKSDGMLIRAVPLENHLFGLKSEIYDEPYKNKSESVKLENFRISDYKEIKYTLRLDNSEDIISLFKMTPYYYKTSRDDQAKLESKTELETEIEFGVIVYEKDGG